MAAESGLDGRTVRRVIDRLIAAGWIKETAGAHQHFPAVHQIVVTRLAVVAKSREGVIAPPETASNR
jgi:hypothetical protein